jgi:hypothetical protein
VRSLGYRIRAFMATGYTKTRDAGKTDF